ncbi:hypothetical protein [Halorhabdus salina]|uniref:hypothetical protein n=1 Tax=Halorhabdus salina TaxID=2750670 RepID=UPI0015EF7CFB|nr:hypothetical protein [Halorhabdus salina]
MDNLDRRRFLAVSLSTTIGSIAGCGVPDAKVSGPYDWAPKQDDGMVTAYIDYTLSEDTSRINPVLPLIVPSSEQNNSDDALASTLSNVDRIADPLLTFPLETGGLVLGTAVLSMATIGLGPLVDPARPTEGATELFFTNGVTVGVGDIDSSDVDETLRSGPERSRFESVGEDGEYTLYRRQSDDNGFVAVGESAVIVAESQTQVEAVLDTRHGSRENVVEADDTFSALIDETDTGHVLVGWNAPIEPAQFSIGDERIDSTAAFISANDDVVSSVTFEPDDGEIRTDLALSADDDVDESQLDEHLGSASADHSLSIDENRVTASGRYTESTVNLNFVADRTTTTRPTVARRDDLPQEVAEAIPDGAFEFKNAEEESTVRVRLVGEFDNAEITIQAVESGFSSTLSVPTSIRWIDVSVDPDGDVVVVSATVDGASGVVARHEVS